MRREREKRKEWLIGSKGVEKFSHCHMGERKFHASKCLSIQIVCLIFFLMKFSNFDWIRLPRRKRGTKVFELFFLQRMKLEIYFMELAPLYGTALERIELNFYRFYFLFLDGCWKFISNNSCGFLRQLREVIFYVTPPNEEAAKEGFIQIWHSSIRQLKFNHFTHANIWWGRKSVKEA